MNVTTLCVPGGTYLTAKTDTIDCSWKKKEGESDVECIHRLRREYEEQINRCRRQQKLLFEVEKTIVAKGGVDQWADLDELDWDAIQRAAAESKWIPHEHYFRNDWIADVCTFLRDGVAPEVATPGNPLPGYAELVGLNGDSSLAHRSAAQQLFTVGHFYRVTGTHCSRQGVLVGFTGIPGMWDAAMFILNPPHHACTNRV